MELRINGVRVQVYRPYCPGSYQLPRPDSITARFDDGACVVCGKYTLLTRNGFVWGHKDYTLPFEDSIFSHVEEISKDED